jgi:serine protease AprX
MGPQSDVADTYVEPAPADIISFSVVAQPRPGVSIDELRDRLTRTTVSEYVAPEHVRTRVAQQLRNRGFEVFDLPSPVVSARGTVALFRSVFGGDLVKRIRTTGPERSRRTTSAIVVRPGGDPPSPEPIEGALLIAVIEPPLFVAPAIPPVTSGFTLHLPGDIAQLTGASATHRLATPTGERATGIGIGAAVIDTGFAPHPYYDQHEYKIKRLAAPDTTSPDVDDQQHGTAVLAALLACAPDVDAYGIKLGVNAVLAFDTAMTLPQLRVVSVSWVYDLAGETVLPLDLLPLWMRILVTVNAGVIVVAAGGNGQTAFPAMMPEVIAVGGVAVDTSDTLSAWSGASSFSSAIFNGRPVPDFCALASDMWLPIPGKSPSGPGALPDWMSEPGTSFAAPQIGGIAALLLQKNQTLTTDGIRTAIAATAVDVSQGTTALGDTATYGPDLATGAGLVNARKAWHSV